LDTAFLSLSRKDTEKNQLTPLKLRIQKLWPVTLFPLLAIIIYIDNKYETSYTKFTRSKSV
jgi:hypothetical protein